MDGKSKYAEQHCDDGRYIANLKPRRREMDRERATSTRVRSSGADVYMFGDVWPRCQPFLILQRYMRLTRVGRACYLCRNCHGPQRAREGEDLNVEGISIQACVLGLQAPDRAARDVQGPVRQPYSAERVLHFGCSSAAPSAMTFGDSCDFTASSAPGVFSSKRPDSCRSLHNKN